MLPGHYCQGFPLLLQVVFAQFALKSREHKQLKDLRVLLSMCFHVLCVLVREHMTYAERERQRERERERHISIYIYIFVCVYVSVCVCVDVFICLFVYVFIYLSMCMYVCIYICVCAHSDSVYMCINI